MNKPGVLLNIRMDVQNKVDAFSEILSNHDVLNFMDGDDQDFSHVKYAVVWKPKPGLLASLPALEVIFSLGAGVDHVYADTNIPDVPLVRFVDPDLTGRMVEWVVLQVLMQFRMQRSYDGQQRERIWQEIPQPAAREVSVGIMGFGELGQASAKGLLPLGFQVNGWARSQRSMEGVTCYAGDDQLDEFLANTDILVSLLPLTPQTHGFLNRSIFEKLRRNGALPGPSFINAGRGRSQVEGDIVDCLNDGTLSGVSLDVFEVEPLPKESPLWTMEQAILTPHVAAISDPDALSRYVANQIAQYENGEPLQNIVDKAQGY